jgi:hypothetical protein
VSSKKPLAGTRGLSTDPAKEAANDHLQREAIAMTLPPDHDSGEHRLRASNPILELPTAEERPLTGFLARSITYEDTTTGRRHYTHAPGGCSCRHQHDGIPCLIARLMDGRLKAWYLSMIQRGECGFLLAVATLVTERAAAGIIYDPRRYYARACGKSQQEQTRRLLRDNGYLSRFRVVADSVMHDDAAEARFRAKVEWHEGPACSVWKAGLDKDGYPRLHVGGHEVRAHRWYFANVILPEAQARFWHIGDLEAFAASIGLENDLEIARQLMMEGLPQDWDVDHRCANRACMSHLRALPKEINRARSRNPGQDEIHRQAMLSKLAARTDWDTAACHVPSCTMEVTALVMSDDCTQSAPVCAFHRDGMARQDRPVILRPGNEPENRPRSEIPARVHSRGEAATRTKTAAGSREQGSRIQLWSRQPVSPLPGGCPARQQGSHG